MAHRFARGVEQCCRAANDLRGLQACLGNQGLLAADGSRAGRISSVLELPGEGWIGLALVRRAALEAPQLLAGEGAAAVTLQISTPAAVQPPPQAGTAAQAAGGAS